VISCIIGQLLRWFLVANVYIYHAWLFKMIPVALARASKSSRTEFFPGFCLIEIEDGSSKQCATG